MQSSTRPVPDTALVEHDPRWTRVLARDPSADRQLVYAVKTTGVYCQPSSLSRLPRPENVKFFSTLADAEVTGYRPSRRTGPDQTTVRTQQTALVAQACRRIEAADTPPTFNVLTQDVGLSSYHFHRLFKSVTGLTPKGYADAHRARKLHAQLERGSTVTEAIYDAGFNASSRFYEALDNVPGMTANRYRAGGVQMTIRLAVGEYSLGSILVAQSGRGVCAILMGDGPDALVRDLQDTFPKAELIGGDVGFEDLVVKVVGLVEAPSIGLDLPLDVCGIVFQERVWQVLREMPLGSTTSYIGIAARIGAPQAVRAVAQVFTANHIAVAIPCHRVICRDGNTSGYRWGVERKLTLLEREAQSAA